VDATNVYWTNESSSSAVMKGTVMKLPLGGGARATLASGQDNPYASGNGGRASTAM